MKKIKNFTKIGITIVFLFVVLTYSASAAGKFNVPLNWVLGPTGTSVDDNNDGFFDTVFISDNWVNSTGDKMTGSLIGLNLNMTYGNFSKGMIVLGNVGIGTATPSTALDVSGTVTATSFAGSGSSLTGIISPPWNSSGTNVFLNDTTAKVGIGQTSPNYKLDVLGSINATNINATGIVQATTFIGSGSSLTGISSTTPPWNSSGTNVFLNDSTANVGFGTSTPSVDLHVVGNANISRNLFVGGNLTFGNVSDYAEMFESDVILDKGDVVCLDAAKKISKCRQRADPSVIGIVSTAPAIIGRNMFGTGKAYPVGLMGVVPAKVKGPVRLFEMLTTSDHEGYAEKATFEDFGAIIGKAMEACYEDECRVDVIVSLQ